MDSVTLFTAEDIKRLRKPVSFPRKGPQGWNKSQVAPAKVLEAFPALSLKKGFVLRAYQFREGDNGNAVVWAMPKDSPFPDPKECPKLKDTFLEAPRPLLALDDLMEAIEGDGSAWSYLSASIFLRQINEFGARWHGCSWSGHAILDKVPCNYSDEILWNSEEHLPSTKAGEWKWLKEKPKEFQPSVCKKNNKIIVTFYSFSGLGVETIYHHVDIFKAGGYCFKTKTVSMAEGRGGYIY